MHVDNVCKRFINKYRFRYETTNGAHRLFDFSRRRRRSIDGCDDVLLRIVAHLLPWIGIRCYRKTKEKLNNNS